MGHWHLRAGRRDEARRWFGKAIEANPASAPAYAFIGLMDLQEQRYADAARAYAEAVRMRPDKLEFRHNYAMTLLELGRDEAAVPHLEILMRSQPARYRDVLADALDRLGRSDEAARVRAAH